MKNMNAAVLVAAALAGGWVGTHPEPMPRTQRVQATSEPIVREARAYTGQRGRWGASAGHTEKGVANRRRRNKEGRKARRANKKRAKK